MEHSRNLERVQLCGLAARNAGSPRPQLTRVQPPAPSGTTLAATSAMVFLSPSRGADRPYDRLKLIITERGALRDGIYASLAIIITPLYAPSGKEPSVAVVNLTKSACGECFTDSKQSLIALPLAPLPNRAPWRYIAN